jgi:hypothetical protein
LAARGENDDPAGADDLLEVDLQPDHEQHEDQAELRDGLDRLFGLHQPDTERADDKAGDQVRQNQRLLEKMRSQPDAPRKQDRERDVANEVVHAGRHGVDAGTVIARLAWAKG